MERRGGGEEREDEGKGVRNGEGTGKEGGKER